MYPLQFRNIIQVVNFIHILIIVTFRQYLAHCVPKLNTAELYL